MGLRRRDAPHADREVQHLGTLLGLAALAQHPDLMAKAAHQLRCHLVKHQAPDFSQLNDLDTGTARATMQLLNRCIRV